MKNINIFIFILGTLSQTKSEASRQLPSSKIANGQPAKNGDIPYQVGLYLNGSLRCGGSFIAVNGQHLVITAAHCVEAELNENNYFVVVGEVKENIFTSPAQVRTVTQILVHEEYESISLLNDITILAIDSPFEINRFVSPIRLPRRKERIGSIGVLSGWGLLSEFGEYADVLQKTKILVGPEKSCARQYGEFVGEKMICAGIRKSACEGDDGGPLKDYKKGFLAGKVSFGRYRCDKPGSNGVFTRVSAYVKWIEETAANIETN